MPFCISCVRIVENPAAHTAGFFRRALVSTKNAVVLRRRSVSLTRCLIAVEQPKIQVCFFLNCTKNIELTAATFARRV